MFQVFLLELSSNLSNFVTFFYYLENSPTGDIMVAQEVEQRYFNSKLFVPRHLIYFGNTQMLDFQNILCLLKEAADNKTITSA